ncbi:MAG TPA: hypothetical protein VIL85_25670 [Thermomicrobiales bacterium]|jgi:hypothetical protein
MSKTGIHHHWTETDDIVALYLHHFGLDHFDTTRESIATHLGMTVAALNMRVANFRALADEGGLGNFAAQSRRVYDRYHAAPEPELRRLVERALA